MERLINMTPHPIVVRLSDGREITFAPTGTIPRVGTVETPAQAIEGVPCVTQKMGDVEGLPEPAYTCNSCGQIDPQAQWGVSSCCQAGLRPVFLIVSAMVFGASDRTDLVAPDTGKGAVRDGHGRILAVTRFLRR